MIKAHVFLVDRHTHHSQVGECVSRAAAPLPQPIDQPRDVGHRGWECHLFGGSPGFLPDPSKIEKLYGGFHAVDRSGRFGRIGGFDGWLRNEGSVRCPSVGGNVIQACPQVIVAGDEGERGSGP